MAVQTSYQGERTPFNIAVAQAYQETAGRDREFSASHAQRKRARIASMVYGEVPLIATLEPVVSPVVIGPNAVGLEPRISMGKPAIDASRTAYFTMGGKPFVFTGGVIVNVEQSIAEGDVIGFSTEPGRNLAITIDAPLSYRNSTNGGNHSHFAYLPEALVQHPVEKAIILPTRDTPNLNPPSSDLVNAARSEGMISPLVQKIDAQMDQVRIQRFQPLSHHDQLFSDVLSSKLNGAARDHTMVWQLRDGVSVGNSKSQFPNLSHASIKTSTHAVIIEPSPDGSNASRVRAYDLRNPNGPPTHDFVASGRAIDTITQGKPVHLHELPSVEHGSTTQTLSIGPVEWVAMVEPSLEPHVQRLNRIERQSPTVQVQTMQSPTRQIEPPSLNF